jgi:hypothetical protein
MVLEHGFGLSWTSYQHEERKKARYINVSLGQYDP